MAKEKTLAVKTKILLPKGTAKRLIQQRAQLSAWPADWAYASKLACRNCFDVWRIDQLTNIDLVTCSDCYSDRLAVVEITLVKAAANDPA